MDFLRDPIWQFIGVLISAIGTIISFFAIRSGSKKQEQVLAYTGTTEVKNGGMGCTLFLIVGIVLAITLFTFIPANSSKIGPNSSVTPSQLEQARTMLQQFFEDINKKDYCDAYKLWIGVSSCQEFAKGYQSTVHIDIQFDSTQLELGSDGKVYLTQIATEKDDKGNFQKRIYKGWYIVKQENGRWKILNGYFSVT